MKKQFNNFWLAAAAVALVSVPGCKEDKPSTVPTQPTTINIENGAEISETEVTLSVSGSTVEDEDCHINYNYYIGTSQDNLAKTDPQNIKLTPYTQYFWYAKAKTETDESEPTEIRTFYCVPPFEIETDNGDGEWAAVLRFKGLSNIKGGKVTLTPDKQGYNYQKEIEIPAGQDSCYIKMGNEHNPTNAAFTHLYDDEHGITYEPIIYTFNATIDVQVGDKSIAVSKEAKEIILEKNSYTHDHEFNVYRLVRIGNTTWMADDLRAKSIVYNGQTIDIDNSGFYTNYNIDTLSTGAIGVSYLINGEQQIESTIERTLHYLKYALPKGFRHPTLSDWFELLKYYGLETTTIYTEYGSLMPAGYSSTDFYETDELQTRKRDAFQGEELQLRGRMSSPFGWIIYDTTEPQITQPSVFNIKPFSGKGNGCFYFIELTETERKDYPYPYVYFIFSTISQGIAIIGYPNSQPGFNYAQIRAVKE